MQSGSDAVLRRMRRRWGSRRFVDRCRLVRNALDRPALTTDVIVGFPGETEADFAATCRVCERSRLLEDPHLSVQPATHDARGHDARPGRAGGQSRALPAAGRRSKRQLRAPILRQPARAASCEVLVEIAGRTAGPRAGHGLPLCPGRAAGRRRAERPVRAGRRPARSPTAESSAGCSRLLTTPQLLASSGSQPACKHFASHAMHSGAAASSSGRAAGPLLDSRPCTSRWPPISRGRPRIRFTSSALRTAARNRMRSIEQFTRQEQVCSSDGCSWLAIGLFVCLAAAPLAAAPPWNKLVLFKHLEADPNEMYPIDRRQRALDDHGRDVLAATAPRSRPRS